MDSVEDYARAVKEKKRSISSPNGLNQ